MNRPFVSIVTAIYIFACVTSVTAKVDFNAVKENYTTKVEAEKEAKRVAEIRKTSPKLYEASYFKKRGVINWNGYRWTWYSQKKLPGKWLKIPGRHVDENNYICDENDYICLASSDLKKGTVVDTPFGKKGKVYDCGCSHGTLDVYTNF